MARAAEQSPIDLGAIASGVRSATADDAFMRGWLDRSWSDRAAFTAALDAELARRLPLSARIEPQLGVDMFEECASGHGADEAGLALREQSGLAFRSFTFSELRDAARAQVCAWRSQGVKPGDCIAIALRVGHDYLAALLAVFHLGAIASPIPPAGKTYLLRRLEQLAPDFVVVHPEHTLWLEKDAKVLAISRGHGNPGSPHVYDPDAPALRLCSAFREFGKDPVALSALDIRRALLRDGLLTLALASGERVAMPGFDALQIQPLMILSVLRMGATWIELDERAVLDDPGLLVRERVDLLGISRAVRDRLLGEPAEVLPAPRAWLRLLNETFDYLPWEAFRARMSANESAAFALLPSAASGGVLLASQPALAAQSPCLWPRAGVEWSLSQVGSEGMPAWHDSGVYAPLRMDAKKKKAIPDESGPQVVLTQLAQGWSFAGSVDNWPDSRALPLAEIARVASQHPRVGVAGAMVTPGRWANEAHLVVGLFLPTDDLDGKVDATALLFDEVAEELVWELGPACRPGRIELFPLYPRWKKDAIDLDWFRAQYMSGALFRRAQEPLFVALAQLAWTFDARLADKRRRGAPHAANREAV